MKRCLKEFFSLNLINVIPYYFLFLINVQEAFANSVKVFELKTILLPCFNLQQ